MTQTKEVKTYAEWKGNLDEYLQIGDVVDIEMVEHFYNVLPPATMTYSLVQIGEPHSHIDGRATYSTLAKVNGEWTYAGHCHRGESEEPKIVVEYLGDDAWNREIYANAEGKEFTVTGGIWYELTDEGEPLCEVQGMTVK